MRERRNPVRLYMRVVLAYGAVSGLFQNVNRVLGTVRSIECLLLGVSVGAPSLAVHHTLPPQTLVKRKPDGERAQTESSAKVKPVIIGSRQRKLCGVLPEAEKREK